MRHSVLLMFAGFLLIGGDALSAQPPKPDADKTVTAKGKPDVTYGRVKELTAGQKIVIDVDDAVDKTFDLSDNDLAVNLGAGLKVGDPVKVTEHSVAGKTKRVQVVRHTGGGVKHGDRSRAEEKK
jgi:hypothetical protein